MSIFLLFSVDLCKYLLMCWNYLFPIKWSANCACAILFFSRAIAVCAYQNKFITRYRAIQFIADFIWHPSFLTLVYSANVLSRFCYSCAMALPFWLYSLWVWKKRECPPLVTMSSWLSSCRRETRVSFNSTSSKPSTTFMTMLYGCYLIWCS